MSCNECIHMAACINLAKSTYGRLKETAYVGCSCFENGSNFLKAPCKVGDTIFCIIHILGETEIVSLKVQRILFTEDDCRLIVQDNNYIGLSANDVGKTIFFTKEEAEEALQRRDLASQGQQIHIATWIYEYTRYGEPKFRCSDCDSVFKLENGDPIENNYFYCPYCGAKML